MKTRKRSTTKWQFIEGRFNLAGVNYSDYQWVEKHLKPGLVLTLVGEPSNRYDSLAIRVEYKGIKLGYVPRYSIFQSELWTAHRRGAHCIAVLTAFKKNNPTWSLITVQCKKTVIRKDIGNGDIKL